MESIEARLLELIILELRPLELETDELDSSTFCDTGCSSVMLEELFSCATISSSLASATFSDSEQAISAVIASRDATFFIIPPVLINISKLRVIRYCHFKKTRLQLHVGRQNLFTGSTFLYSQA
jgi:hypothetical protein